MHLQQSYNNSRAEHLPQEKRSLYCVILPMV